MQKQLILASQSPRRREMVGWLNLAVQQASADIDETPHQGEDPRQLAARLAEEKAVEVRKKYKHGYILAADTIVDSHHQILGKPNSTAQAVAILGQLRSAKHQVHTAVSFLLPDEIVPFTRLVTSDVWMRRYSDGEISDYVKSGDPMDKAGAYAIQHRGFHPVHRLNRCYANVVGFPLCAILHLLHPYLPANSVNPTRLCQRHFGYRCPGHDKGIQL